MLHVLRCNGHQETCRVMSRQSVTSRPPPCHGEHNGGARQAYPPSASGCQSTTRKVGFFFSMVILEIINYHTPDNIIFSIIIFIVKFSLDDLLVYFGWVSLRKAKFFCDITTEHTYDSKNTVILGHHHLGIKWGTLGVNSRQFSNFNIIGPRSCGLLRLMILGLWGASQPMGLTRHGTHG